MTARRRRSALTAALSAAACLLATAPAAAAPPLTTPATTPATMSVTQIAGGLEIPWGAAFFPDGSLLVGERNSGRILRLHRGQVTEVYRIALPPRLMDPADPFTLDEGGLLGISVSPGFLFDQTVFIYHSTATDHRVVRVRLGGTPVPILTGITRTHRHAGGRIAFGPDRMLYVSVGDGGDPASAQDPADLNGKILRMTPDGRPAPGNPFRGSVVWTMGHRNIQGFDWDDAGRMYASELGDKGPGDELNRIQPGGNYGWPLCAGACGDPAFVAPLVTWDNLEASPAGVAIREGTIYIGALRGERMWTVPLRADGSVGEPTAIFHLTYGRIRTVLRAPDGSLWFTTSNRDNPWSVPAPDDDRVLRLG